MRTRARDLFVCVYVTLSCGLFNSAFDNMFVSMYPTPKTHSTSFRTLDAILKIRLVRSVGRLLCSNFNSTDILQIVVAFSVHEVTMTIRK